MATVINKMTNDKTSRDVDAGMPACAVADLIVCPACRSELILDGERILCSNTDCIRSDKGFPWIESVPGLIDFDRSIISEGGLIASRGRSVVARGGLIWRRLSYAMLNLSGVQPAFDRRAAVFLDSVRKTSDGDAMVLIIGGANMSPGSPFREVKDIRLVASDIYHSPSTHVLADGHFLPFRSASFDGVSAQAVLEHVLDPAIVVSEINRVLKPGGVVYAETSFMQQVHEAAFDFSRFTHSGHRWLFRDFDEIQSGASDGPGHAFLWSIRYFVRGLIRTKLAGIVAELGMLWVRIFDKLIPEAFAIDSTSGVFFIGRKAATSLSPKDMIAYYRGAGRS
jgi:SAM-dependent methyltransferase